MQLLFKPCKSNITPQLPKNTPPQANFAANLTGQKRKSTSAQSTPGI